MSGAAGLAAWVMRDDRAASAEPLRRWAAWALEIFILTIPLEGLVTGSFGRLARLVGFAAFGVAGLAIARHGVRRRIPAVAWAFMAFTAVVTLSWFWTISADATLQRIETAVQLVVMVLLLNEFGDTAQQRRRFLGAFVVGCVAASVAVFRAALTGAGAGGGSYSGRFAVGESSNPNSVGAVMAFGSATSWYLAVIGRTRLGRRVAFAAPVLMVVALLLTASRGALIVMIVALLVIPLTSRSLRPRQAVALLLVAPIAATAMLLVIPQTTIERLASTGQELESGDLNLRRQLWDVAIETFVEQPITGVGAGASRIVIGREVGREAGAHDAFLSIAAETGVLGLSAFLTMLGLAALAALRLPAPHRGAAIALLVTLFVALVPLHVEFAKTTWLIPVLVSMGLASPRSPTLRVEPTFSARPAVPVSR